MQDCGNLDPTRAEAFEDFKKGASVQEGLMNCYCFKEFGEHGPGVRNIKFSDGIKHCKEWFEHYTRANLIIYAAAFIIAIVNVGIKVILRALSQFEKRLTKTKELTISTMMMFTITFLNTGVIITLVNAHWSLDEGLPEAFPIFNGRYPEFNIEWY